MFRFRKRRRLHTRSQQPIRQPSPAVAWAVRAGAAEADVHTAWRSRTAAEVPIGQQWDVVRVTRTVAVDSVMRLQARGVRLGPILEVPLRAVFEFVVPPGTARSWPDLPVTVCVDRGTIRCPAPYLTAASGHSARCRRRWVVPPTPAAAPFTDPDALCEVIATTLTSRARAFEREAR